MVKWGVLGTAAILDKNTARAMRAAENCELYAIAGRNPEKVDAFQAKYGFQKNIRIDSEILRPQIRSRFFKEKEGTFKVKEILEDYFELMIDTGAEIGIKVGFGIVIEDIQKDQINYDKLKNLSETEIMMYIQKEHSDYIFKKHNNCAC
jgi:hypothetical protein